MRILFWRSHWAVYLQPGYTGGQDVTLMARSAFIRSQRYGIA